MIIINEQKNIEIVQSPLLKSLVCNFNGKQLKWALINEVIVNTYKNAQIHIENNGFSHIFTERC